MQSGDFAHAAFLRRALAEAARYGEDAWVFLRELGQNARDAGARRIDINLEEQEGSVRLSFADDGCGMSMEHARRFFFKLYASSKEGEAKAAGRFGVGFWSVLRFAPARLEVHSNDGRRAWGLAISGDLKRAEEIQAACKQRGTRVVLWRVLQSAAQTQALRAELLQAVETYLAHLRDNGRRPKALPVFLDGQPMNRPFSIDSPNQLAFRSGNAEGVVGLGRRPAYHLYARGLPVLSGAYLEELEGQRFRKRPVEPEGSAPVHVLNGNDLEVVLSRRRILRDRHLERLLRLARLYFEDLVSSAIDGLGPLGPVQKLSSGLRRGWRRLRRAPLSLSLSVLLLFLVAAGGLSGALLASRLGTVQVGDDPVVLSLETPSVVQPSAQMPEAAAGRSLPRLQSPAMQLVTGPPRPALPDAPAEDGRGMWALEYEPPRRALFRLSVLPRFDPRLGWQAAAPGGDFGSLKPVLGKSRRSLKLRLRLDEGSGPWSLPVASEYQPLPGTARLDGRPVRLEQNSAGLLRLALDEPLSGPRLLEYELQWMPQPARPRPHIPEGSAPPLLVELLKRVSSLDPHLRAEVLARELAQILNYERSEELTREFSRSLASGRPWLQTVFELGAGDCDVLNGVLAWALLHSGLQARLVTGVVGRQGRGLPGLHAWVELSTDDGLQVLDISEDAQDFSGPAPEAPEVSGPDVVEPSSAGRAAARREARLLPVLAGLLFLSLAGLFALTFRTGRVRLSMSRAPAQRQSLVAGMARDALMRPAAWREVPGVWHRAFLPDLRGGRLSLSALLDRAERGTAFLASPGNELLSAAESRRMSVLDPAARDFGPVFQAVPGLRDLDALLPWRPVNCPRGLLALLIGLEGLLRQAGFPVPCMAVRPAEVERVFRLLDLSPLRPPASSAWPARFVAVVVEAPWLQRLPASPQLAMLAAADRLAAEAGLNDAVARALRHGAGRRLLDELREEIS